MSSALSSSAAGASLWQRAKAELTQRERDQLAKADSNASSAPSTFASTKVSLEASTRAFQDRSLAITLPSSQNGGKRRVLLRDIFRRAIEWLNVVTTVGDKIVQFDTSGHAALPWAGIKLLVELVTSDVKKYDGVLEGIGTIIHNLTFYAEWQRLYANRPAQSDASTLFDDALVQLYAAILRYQAAALHYFEENRLMRIGKGISSAFLPSTKLQGHLDALMKAETEAGKVAQLLDADLMQQMSINLDSIADQLRDLQVAHNEGNVKILDALEASARPMHAVMDYVESQKLIAVLNWFSTAPFQTTHESIYEKVVPDTGAWLLQHEKFQNWITSPESGILCLHGTMGMGKSCLASIMIKHLEDTSQSSTSVSKTAFYYFVRDSGRTSDRDALAALARQLAATASTSQLLTKAQNVCDTYLRKGVLSATELSVENVREIVSEFASQYRNVWLVLDAMDESEDAAEIYEALQAIIQKCEIPVKVFLTSRESSAENPGLAELYGRFPNLSIRDGIQSGDIASFVDARMDELIKKKKLLGSIIGKDKIDVAAKLRATILSHADGMFRWAEMRLIELCGSRYRLKSSILKALDQAPQALSEIYDSIYHGLCEDGETTESRLAKAILCWMIYARAPMEKMQLMSALRIYCNAGLEKDEVNEDLVQALLPGFFHVVYFPTNGLGMFEFAHLSVREHFQGHGELSKEVGHTVIAITCLRRLISYADDFKNGNLPTVIDLATWKDSMSRSMFDGEVVEEDTRSCGSLVIGHNPDGMLELRMRRRRLRLRRRERKQQQADYSDSYQIDDNASISSASSSRSSMSEAAAAASAQYVRIHGESDVFVEYFPEGGEDESNFDPVNDIDRSDVVRVQGNAGANSGVDGSEFLGELHQPRSYSLNEISAYRPRSYSDNEALTQRPRSYSVNDGPVYQWQYNYFQEPSGYRAQTHHASELFELFASAERADVEYDADYESVKDVQNEVSSSSESDSSDSSVGFDDKIEIEIEGENGRGGDWNHYPLVLEERQRFRKMLREGKMSLEEFTLRKYDILRTQLLKYARMHWHFHLARSPYLSSTMMYNEGELQTTFEEFCNVSATEKVVVDDGLPFVLWYDWLRQDFHFLNHDLHAFMKGKRFLKRGQKDRWLIRLNEVCKFAGIEPGCHIAKHKIEEEAARKDGNG